MEGKYRTTAQYEQDKLLISELYLRGNSYRKIAEKISEVRDYTISFSTIAGHVQELLKEWRSSQSANIDERKVEEIQKLNRLELEYWQAWEQSRNGAHAGNARFLNGIKDCIALRCSILGLNKNISDGEKDSFDVNNQQTNIYLGLPLEMAEALKNAGPIWKQRLLEEHNKKRL